VFETTIETTTPEMPDRRSQEQAGEDPKTGADAGLSEDGARRVASLRRLASQTRSHGNSPIRPVVQGCCNALTLRERDPNSNTSRCHAEMPANPALLDGRGWFRTTGLSRVKHGVRGAVGPRNACKSAQLVATVSAWRWARYGPIRQGLAQRMAQRPGPPRHREALQCAGDVRNGNRCALGVVLPCVDVLNGSSGRRLVAGARCVIAPVHDRRMPR
jgi:hypothetical protein